MNGIVTAEGCRIHYDVVGDGPPVVLIPGLGGDGRFWAPVAEQLKERFRLILVDHRGAGRSDRPAGPYTIETLAADVLAIMDAEDCPRAHAVGHSTGGTVVQTLALDAPERVGRIVISGSWPGPDPRFRALFQARLALLEAGRPDIYQAFTHVLGYDAAWIAAHEGELTAAVECAAATLAPLEVTAARIRMLLAYDRSADLASITAPTLVLGAHDDEMILFEQSERIAHAIPGATLAVFDGGHFYPRTRAERFSREVGGFLSSPARPDRSSFDEMR